MQPNSVSLYSSMSEEMRNRIEENSIVKTYKAGEPLLKQRQYIGSAMIVKQGIVKAIRNEEEGRHHFLYFLKEGELCVLSTLCCLRIRQSDMQAEAYSDSEVLYLPAHLAERWMQEYPEWSRFVMQSFNQRMSELLETMDSLIFKHLDERLLYYLYQHYQVTGAKLSLSHQHIADELNTSREVVTRQLKKLESSGYVEVNRSFIHLTPKVEEEFRAKR